MFNSTDLQDRLHERPFVPFRLVMSSGESYEVRHPELVLVSRRFLIIGSPSERHKGQFDGYNRLSVLHIADLQDIPTEAAPPSNGQAASGGDQPA